MRELEFDIHSGHYWGAIIAMPNATNHFDTAVHDGIKQAEDLVRYIYNEVRWVTVAESYILPSLTATVNGLNSCFSRNVTAPRLADETLSLASTRVLLDGIQASPINIKAFIIGMRPFLNTVGMVFPILLAFFFIMAMGGIAQPSAWYQSDRILSRYLNRILLSLLYSCVVGISWGLWLEVYREDFAITGGQYCLVWLIYWIYTFIAFEVLDTAAAFVPMPFLPLCVLTYVIINVGASVFPIDIKPTFYHLDYIWPSYNCFELLISVLSDGSTSRVYRNVPVLFGWLFVWMPLGFMANRKRCRMAQ
ncbi:hypothetical protein N7462_002541 [Penicillium macrosclerotiorum]|uniref:uncharacterized protein n=1 Tax=Penicillium macrosclerotiorum TaxID=303699 RepID=UPI002546A454|nr:uncharacterized protein N7462_002541 [Penicillium macrosclerotiorum]KAJ5693118.1 hypothetical protein N7462_002541 [Penicillium macrosclerotiorum]